MHTTGKKEKDKKWMDGEEMDLKHLSHTPTRSADLGLVDAFGVALNPMVESAWKFSRNG